MALTQELKSSRKGESYLHGLPKTSTPGDVSAIIISQCSGNKVQDINERRLLDQSLFVKINLGQKQNFNLKCVNSIPKSWSEYKTSLPERKSYCRAGEIEDLHARTSKPQFKNTFYSVLEAPFYFLCLTFKDDIVLLNSSKKFSPLKITWGTNFSRTIKLQ